MLWWSQSFDLKFQVIHDNLTYSSVFSFLIPSQSFIRFCRTPLWLSQLHEKEAVECLYMEERLSTMKMTKWGAKEGSSYTRYWSLIFLSWMRSGFKLFIFLSCLPVVQSLCFQVLFKPGLTVVNLAKTGFELLVVHHYPEKETRTICKPTDQGCRPKRS